MAGPALGGWIPGETFVDRRTLVRSGVAGDLIVRYTPPAGSEFLVLGLRVTNGDVAARIAQVRFEDANALPYLALAYENSLAASDNMTAPNQKSDKLSGFTAWPIVSSPLRLMATVQGVTVGEDATFACYARYIGSPPTVSEVIA